MKRLEFMKAVFDFLDSFSKPFDKEEEILILRWLIGMIEDCLTWEEILKHLKEGCQCEELKGEEGRRALREELKLEK